MSYKLGLTGSIGMGKSTTAAMFADAGIPVWDADASVHRLYAKNGLAVLGIAEVVPNAIGEEGVDRSVLKDWIAVDPEARLAALEAIVHPLVAADREAFMVQHAAAPLIVLDIPLLFETGADQWLDGVLVVSAPPEVQRDRVLARTGMTEAQLQSILARQMPDAEKRARADYVIQTIELQPARTEVHRLIKDLTGQEQRHA